MTHLETGLPGLASGAAAKLTKRLLLLKFGAIGDVIMAVPAARAMYEAGYRIDWVAGETVAPVLELYPWIRVIPVNEAKLLQGSFSERVWHVWALWRVLGRVGRGGYDLCATLYYDRRYRLLTLPVRARRWVHLSREERGTRLLPGRHHTDEFWRILSGRPDGEMPAQLAPVTAPGLPPRPRLWPAQRPRVVLVPAGARNLLRDDALRRWPVEQYVRLAERLVGSGCEVVLAGGPEDGWASPHFEALRATVAEGSFADLIGTLSLVEMLALLDSAEVTVTHDTGPLHLAGITSTAIVSLFGPTDPHGRLPQRENCVALWGGEGFACRPCYDGRDYAPCAHNGCLAEVDPAWVAEQVREMIRVRREGRSLPPRVLVPGHRELVQLEPTLRQRIGA